MSIRDIDWRRDKACPKFSGSFTTVIGFGGIKLEAEALEPVTEAEVREFAKHRADAYQARIDKMPSRGKNQKRDKEREQVFADMWRKLELDSDLARHFAQACIDEADTFQTATRGVEFSWS